MFKLRTQALHRAKSSAGVQLDLANITCLFDFFGSNLHERVVIAVIVRDHVGIIVWVLLVGSVGLASIHLVVIVLVEWIWSSESVETIALLCDLLRGNLHERVVIAVIVRGHVGIIVWVLLVGSVRLASIHLVIIVLVEWIWSSESVESIALLSNL